MSFISLPLCRASSNKMISSVTITIFGILCLHFVAGGLLEIQPLKRPIWLLASSSLELTCLIKDNSTVEWWKNGEKFSGKRQNYVYTSEGGVKKLIIQDTTPDDAGLYACKVPNSQEQVEVTVKLLQVSVHNAQYKSGKSATLRVTPENLSEADRKSMIVTWLKNGTAKVTADSTHIIDKVNNSLTLTAPTRQDIGKYVTDFKFEVSLNGVNDYTVLAQPVYLFAKPHIKAGYRSKNLVEGDILMLECQASGYPVPNITWYKGDDVITPGNRTSVKNLMKDDLAGNVFVKDGLLIIKDLSFSDRADYMCEASNSLGSYNYTVTLHVKDKLAALWPFLAIVCEVVTLCVIIFIYEKKKSKELDAAAAAHLNGKHAEYGDVPRDKKPSKEDVRLRKS